MMKITEETYNGKLYRNIRLQDMELDKPEIIKIMAPPFTGQSKRFTMKVRGQEVPATYANYPAVIYNGQECRLFVWDYYRTKDGKSLNEVLQAVDYGKPIQITKKLGENPRTKKPYKYYDVKVLSDDGSITVSETPKVVEEVSIQPAVVEEKVYSEMERKVAEALVQAGRTPEHPDVESTCQHYQVKVENVRELMKTIQQ